MNEKRLTRTQTLLMAVTAGVTIANVYYAQPILSQIAASLHASEAEIGNLPALTQAGFGLGLLFLAPLGDMINRKIIVVVLEVLLAVALFGMTAVENVAGAYALSLAIGVLAVAVQIVLPMAAALSPPETKGKILGIVFTGTVTGILSARIFSGYITEWLGWRWVYGMSSVLALGVTALVLVGLPNQRGDHAGGYGALMKSTVWQFARLAKLRRISLLGALIFGAFCSFWTTLTFHLSAPPFNYRSDQIGLFGFVAIGGALAAPWFGRMADKASPERAQVLTTGLMLAGLAISVIWSQSTVAFTVAIFLIDVGVQGTQVNNLAQLYGLDETAHSRINAVFMTIFFVGGAIGTYCGVLAWSIGGWPLVSAQLLTWTSGALAIAVVNHHARTGLAGARPHLGRTAVSNDERNAAGPCLSPGSPPLAAPARRLSKHGSQPIANVLPFLTVNRKGKS